MHQSIRNVHIIDLCSHCKKDHFSMTIETTFLQGFVNVDASLACTRPQCTVVFTQPLGKKHTQRYSARMKRT